MALLQKIVNECQTEDKRIRLVSMRPEYGIISLLPSNCRVLENQNLFDIKIIMQDNKLSYKSGDIV